MNFCDSPGGEKSQSGHPLRAQLPGDGGVDAFNVKRMTALARWRVMPKMPYAFPVSRLWMRLLRMNLFDSR